LKNYDVIWMRCFSFYLILAVVVLLAISPLVPKIIQQQTQRLWRETFPDSSLDYHLAALSPYHAEITNCRIGPQEKPAVIIPRIALSYQPGNLLKKKIDILEIDGCRLHLVKDANGLRLQGVSLPIMASGQGQDTEASLFQIQHIRFRQGTIVLLHNESRYILPFAIDVEWSEKSTLKGTLTIMPRQQTAVINISVDLQSRQAHIRGEWQPLVERFADLWQRVEGLSINGRPAIQAMADIDLKEKTILKASFSLKLQDVLGRYQGQIFRGSPLAELSGEFDKTLRLIQKGAIEVAGPLTCRIHGLKGDFIPEADRTGTFDVKTELIAVGNSSLKGPVNFKLHGKITSAEGKQLQVRLQPAESQELKFAVAGQAITVSRPEAACVVNGNPDLVFAQCTGKASEVLATKDALTLKLLEPVTTLSGQWNNNALVWQVNARTKADGRMKSMTAVADVVVSGSQDRYDISLQNGTLTGDTFGGEQITGQLSWPLLDAAAVLTIGKAFWQGRLIGNGHLKVISDKDSFILTGGVNALDQLSATAEGRIDKKGHGEIVLHLPRQEVQETEIIDGVNIDGNIGGEGRLSLTGAGSLFTVTADLHDLTLVDANHSLVVSKINGSVPAEILPQFRIASSPLRFQDLLVGDYGFADGEVVFQLESTKKILLEKARVKWCNGVIRAMAVRFGLDDETISADLYCDRINLAQLLEKFGVNRASGEGRVSGRIPIFMEGKKIHFDDGFLYSTPGKGGHIALGDSKMLTAGVPVDSPHYLQLDFAGEALKDFRYDWVKVGMSSEGDDVLMSMNMYGRPAKPLPFRYDASKGIFKRLLVQSAGGIDQPIQLDVNFRIPFNELLGYGKSFKQVFELNR